jgi:hypothetical protein
MTDPTVIVPEGAADIKRWAFGEEQDTGRTVSNGDLDFENELKVYERDAYDVATGKAFRFQLSNVSIRKENATTIRMLSRWGCPLVMVDHGALFEALHQSGIADEQFDTTGASSYVRGIDNAALMDTLFPAGAKTCVADLTLDLTHLKYTESVAAITFDESVFVMQ